MQFQLTYQTPYGAKRRVLATLTDEETARHDLARQQALHAAIKASGRTDYKRLFDVTPIPPTA